MNQASLTAPFVQSIFHPSDFSKASELAFALALIRKTRLVIMQARRGDIDDWAQFPPVRKTLERWQALPPGEFDAKWLRGGASADERLVGSSDIQSLADLGNSLEVIRTMQIAPMTRDALLRLVAATLAPIVPLALTMMPLEKLLKKLLGILL